MTVTQDIGSVNNDGYTYEVNEDKTEATLYEKETKKSNKKSYNAVKSVNNAVAIELEVNARDVSSTKDTAKLMKEEELEASLRAFMLESSGNNIFEKFLSSGEHIFD